MHNQLLQTLFLLTPILALPSPQKPNPSGVPDVDPNAVAALPGVTIDKRDVTAYLTTGSSVPSDWYQQCAGPALQVCEGIQDLKRWKNEKALNKDKLGDRWVWDNHDQKDSRACQVGFWAGRVLYGDAPDYKLLPNKENPDASPDTLERCLKIIYGIANNFIGVDPKNANRGLYNIAEPPTSVDDLAHTGTQPDSTKPGYIVQGYPVYAKNHAGQLVDEIYRH